MYVGWTDRAVEAVACLLLWPLQACGEAQVVREAVNRHMQLYVPSGSKVTALNLDHPHKEPKWLVR